MEMAQDSGLKAQGFDAFPCALRPEPCAISRSLSSLTKMKQEIESPLTSPTRKAIFPKKNMNKRQII